MSRLSENLNARRIELDLTYESVWEALQDYPWPPGIKPPSLSVVGHWFNGGRRPRKMEHLKGLCDVLGISIDAAAGAASKEARTDEEQVLLDAFRQMESGQDREMLLANALHLARRNKAG